MEAQAEGLIRTIGVSNFGIRHLEELLAVEDVLAPAINQVSAISVTIGSEIDDDLDRPTSIHDKKRYCRLLSNTRNCIAGECRNNILELTCLLIEPNPRHGHHSFRVFVLDIRSSNG
jgi:hypothetical protein